MRLWFSAPGRLERRQWAIRLTAGLAVLAAVCIVGGARPISSEAAPTAQQEPARTGGAYWAGRYGCVACHGVRGEGTLIGPAIVGRPDSPLSYELYLRQLRTPLLLMPDYPPESVSDAQVRAILEHFSQFEPAP